MDQNKKKLIKELIAYLFFGVMTTVVALVTYFVILWLGEHAFKIDPSSGGFYAIRIAAQILQWVFAVLFAFYTNKKWVFTSAETNVSTWKQLLTFSSSRLVTLGFDTAITFGTVALLQAVGYTAIEFNFIIKIAITADLISKIAASVVVIVLNYVFSKLFVFKNKKNDAENGESEDNSDKANTETNNAPDGE